MIQAGSITAYLLNEYSTGFKDSYSYVEEKHLILKAIHERKDYRYFDKWGNEFTTQEIQFYCNVCQKNTPCSGENFGVPCENEKYQPYYKNYDSF